MEAGVEDAIAFLHRAAANGGGSLYDHLTDVITQVLSQRPENALESLEAISFEVKETAHSQDAPDRPDVEDRPSAKDLDVATRVLELARRERKERESAGDDVLGELSTYERLGEEREIWACAGVGCVARADLKTLVLSMRELQETRQLEFVRLWGKVMGRRADYLVCESAPREGSTLLAEMGGQVSSQQQNPREVPPDEEGAPGSNRFVYWVCTKIGGEWRRLPQVTPAQIAAARRIRKFFSGDLDAPVFSWPAFPGKEENYLRAQIARISAAACVSPKGLYGALEQDAVDDEEMPEQLELVEQEDYSGLPVSSLMDPRNWVHHTPAILIQGRCTFWRVPKEAPPPKDKGEAEGEDNGDETDAPTTDNEQPQDEEDEEEVEQGPPILSSVADDSSLPGAGNLPSWVSRRICGVPGKGACVVLTCNRWPGAYATAYGPQFANLYVGFGLKCGAAPAAPEIPKEPAHEYVPEEPLIEAEEPTLEQEKELEEKARKEAEELERQRQEAEKLRLEKEAAAAAAASAESEAAGTSEADTAGESTTDVEGKKPPDAGAAAAATTTNTEDEEDDDEEETESEVPK